MQLRPMTVVDKGRSAHVRSRGRGPLNAPRKAHYLCARALLMSGRLRRKGSKKKWTCCGGANKTRGSHARIKFLAKEIAYRPMKIPSMQPE